MSAKTKAPARRAGNVGVQSGSTDRKDSGSASMMPTSTSPTIRPPTGALAEANRLLALY